MSPDPLPQELPTLEYLGVDKPGEISATEVATAWFNSFSSAITSLDIPGILDLFVDDGFWKDTLALTWDFRSIKGKDKIKRLLEQRLAPTGLDRLSLSHAPFRGPELQTLFPDLVLLRLTFEFGTQAGMGSGVVNLVPVPGSKWKAYMVYTTLQSLHDFPEQIGPLRRKVAEHGTWAERRRREIDLAEGDPTVLIVGAGHTGLEIAARLKSLGVSHLILDKKARVGDSWRDRYKALCLHDTVWYNQTPYLPFPDTWPVFSPASKLADWLEGYANYLELNVWTSSVITETEWDADLKTWTVEVQRGGKETRTLKVKHLVFATGFGGRPRVPDVPGREDFKGDVVHSTDFASASNYVGKKVVIVGACTSAHDIAQDCFNNKVDVTIYQRSSTYVISVGAVEQMLAAHYNDTISTEVADLYFNCIPSVVLKAMQKRITPFVAQTTDKALLDGLAKAGFQTNLGIDNTGLFGLSLARGGGYYFDVGTSKHIIDGDIHVKHGSTLARFTPHGLAFEDGTTLEADVVVFATGYGDPRDSMREVCGPQVADAVKPLWVPTDEGELSGIWRGSGHEALWFGIGNFGVSRYHSRHLALQIKAIEAGILKPFEVKF